MKHLPRILAVLAVACMLMLFLFPMWRITLFAPQYPEAARSRSGRAVRYARQPGSVADVGLLPP